MEESQVDGPAVPCSDAWNPSVFHAARDFFSDVFFLVHVSMVARHRDAGNLSSSFTLLRARTW